MERQRRSYDLVHLRRENSRRAFDVLGGRRRDQRVIGDGQTPRSWEHATGRPGFMSARDRHWKHGGSEGAGESEGARFESLESAIRTSPALGKDHDCLAAQEQAHRLARGLGIRRLDLHRERAKAADQPREPWHPEQRIPGHVIHWPAYRDGDQHRISVGHVIRHDDQRPGGRDMTSSVETDAKIGARAEPHTGPKHIQEWGAHSSIMPWR